MISQKELKEYGFKGLDQYFEMMAESRLNGNFTQHHEQVKRLSLPQKVDAIRYFMRNECNEATTANFKTIDIILDTI